MIPVLYPATQLTYTTNGIGRLVDAISCIVTEELNGVFELEMEYPVNGKYYPQIRNGGIIGVVYNGKLQPFDINKVTVSLDGICTVNASHVSNRTAFAWISGGRNYQTLDQMIYRLNHSGQVPYVYNFVYSTDIVSAGTIYAELKECAKSLVARLAVAFQGEIEYDVRDVKILARRGTDTGIIVSYGKNISDMERELDWSSTWNAICPYWDSGTASNSPYTPSTAIQPVPQTPVIPKYVNFYETIDHYPTQQELYDAGVAYMNANHPWVPFDNVQTTVLEVSDNDPAKGLRIGDTLTVVFTQAGITLENTRVIGVEYNVLLERNDTITVGSPQKEFVAVEGLSTDEPQFVTPSDLNSRLENYATKTEVNGLFAWTYPSGSASVAGSSSSGEVTINISKSGYTPVGIMGFSLSGDRTTFCILARAYINSAGTQIRYILRNTNATATGSTSTITFYVLWAKSI